MRSSLRLSIGLMLAPALLVIVLFFAGGLLIALAQSLGYFAPAGESGFTLAHYAQLLSDVVIQILQGYYKSIRFTQHAFITMECI